MAESFILEQLVFSFHSALCLFTLKPRDRRQLMPTKAHVTKKALQPALHGILGCRSAPVWLSAWLSS